MGVQINLYCEHISKNSVHCDRYTTLGGNTIDECVSKVEESDWQVSDGEVICPNH